MDWNKELIEKEGVLNEVEDINPIKDKSDKIGQNQFYDIITSRKPDWQAIIYDLIHTEQLDPWDIDLVVLTEKYFEKVLELEKEMSSSDQDITDFYASSKVLLAAALLLRIKSEFLLNKHIKSIDELLFGKKEDKKYAIERIEIEEDELPILIPKTPLPRARRITLAELMGALNKAINTESRRIKREVSIKRAQKLSEVDFPSFSKIDLKDRIKHFYARVLTSLKKKAVTSEKHLNKVGYSDLIGKERDEKLASFLPLLHLSNTQKLWLEQQKHLDEIWVYLHTYFIKNKDNFVEELEKDIEEMKEELAAESVEETIVEFIGEEDDGIKLKGKEIDTAIQKNAENIIDSIEKEVRGSDELDKLIDEKIKSLQRPDLLESFDMEIEKLNKDKKIEEISGFEDEQE
ncbi:MAG: segregation/condensation protein A [Candidatus Pacearchaeota archaeon]|jgi:chromatin segregation and condensation protein Rec8/ScpA/Scc1 (kleisin family)